jgi:hypothetical protein
MSRPSWFFEVSAVALEEEITTNILKHRQLRWCPPEVEEQDITVAGPNDIKKAAAARFGRACDSGVLKRLSSVLLEPANPFDPKAPRRLRREVVVLGSMVLSFLLLALYFNFATR